MSKKPNILLLRFLRKSLPLMGKAIVILLIIAISMPLGIVPGQKKPPEIQAASTLTLTSTSDWDAGTKSGVETESRLGDLKMEADGAWNAKAWQAPDLTISVGSAFTSDGTDIYAFRGYGNPAFYKYTPTQDEWTELAIAPHGTYYGAELVVLGDYVYALFGGYQTVFGRYSITDNAWTLMDDIPDLVYEGGSLTTDGTDMYALRGNTTQDFYKYDVSEDSWNILSGTPAYVRRGADLVYDDGYLYTPRGSNTTTFYRYNISTDTWDTRATLPGSRYDDGDITTDGTYIFVPRMNNTTTFYRYDISANTWSTIASAPIASRYSGAVYHSGDGYVYFFRGNGQYDFWKYHIGDDEFIGPESAPATLSTGSDLTYYNGYMYVPRGSTQTTMYRYSTSGDSWETMSAAPDTFADDTKGVEAGGVLYYYRGGNTTTFYSYTPGGSWATLGVTPANVRFGGGLAYTGSGDYIYGTRGSTQRTFWRYSILGNSWDDGVVADLPADAECSYGCRLTSDGTDIYYIAGIGISRMFKYSISGDSWTEVASPPFAPYYGTDITYNSTAGKILALAGYYKDDLWEYTISTDTWRKLYNMSTRSPADRGYYNGSSIEWDGSTSYYITRGYGYTDMYTYTPGSDSYTSSATWTSDVQDLTYVDSWTSLTNSTTTPDDSSVSFQTRTSADNITWTSWENVSGTTIASTAQRYLQIKATLNAATDLDDTPSLHSITVTYTGDETDPSNPSVFTGSSQEIGGVSLTSGNTYVYPHPYFAWTGASDGQGTVSGYYVYWGATSDADPETLGSYQTASDYLVTSSLNSGSTYYLRVKTKDNSGNISSASAGFTYGFNGVSPTQTLLVDETSEFLGTGESVSVSGDEIKLSSKAGFWKEHRLSNTPGSMQYGAKNAAYVSSTNKLYYFRGNNTTTFYSYDIDSDTWSTLAAAPGAIRMGGGVVEGPPGYLYGWRGNNQKGFYRYDIGENEWSDGDAADTPSEIYYGGSAIYDGSEYIYMMRGDNADDFWRYDPAGDSWEALSNLDFGATSDAINNYAYVSADLAFDGVDTIYATQGYWRDGFSSYDINSGEWSVLTDLPASPYLGSSIEYDSINNAVYFMPGYYQDKLYKYDISTQEWTQMSSAPYTFYYGGNIRKAGNYFYAIRGANSTTFYKYDITNDSWLKPTRGLFGTEFEGTSYLNAYYGADIVKGNGNYFYLTRGYYDNSFVRYDESTGSVVKMSDLPVGAYNGSSLVYDSTNDKIYFTGGVYVQKFYVYDIATDAWTEEASDPMLANVNYGASMVYDGSQYVYATRGGNGSNLYRFDTQGSAGSKWDTMTSNSAGFGYGSELAIQDGYLYAMRGQNVANNPLYRYDIAEDEWSDVDVADMVMDPDQDDIYNDGFMANGGDGYLYVARGENDTEFYRYNISGDSWSALEDAPANINEGGSGESNGSDQIYVLPGGGSNTFQDGLYTYVQQTSTSSFENSGTYTSTSHDFTAVYKWANLVLTYTLADNASLTVETRSSPDDSDWTSWAEVTEEKQIGTTYTYKINSAADRYLQVRFSLTSSDGLYSGIVSDYTVNYFQDTTEPINPTSLTAYSTATKSASLVNEDWYAHTDPIFDWPEADDSGGATDGEGGSGVVGYWVYFGNETWGDPEGDDGVYVTDSEYAPSTISEADNYYLRIKTVDDAGLISSATWAPFIYNFDNVNPTNPQTLTADPPGYTASNSFTFTWSGATDADSGVMDYCYRTGAIGSVDTCTDEATVSAIPSYRTGTNTFYVRSRDRASNVPTEYSTASYYYNATAPSPPQNVVIAPTTNTINEFTITWDPPSSYKGSQTGLRYYYSINAEPTVNNVNSVGLTNTYLPAGAYADQMGENTFYVVAKDEAGNVDYDLYYKDSVTNKAPIFSIDTETPGEPEDIEIADVSVKATESWRLALSWDEPESSGSGIDNYRVYRSTDDSADCDTDISAFTLLASASNTSYVDVKLDQETYYYCAQSCDSVDNCSTYSDTVSMLPDGRWLSAPELTASPSATARTKTATVAWSTSRTSNSFVKYGTSSGTYGEEVGSSLHVTSHEVDLEGLTPGTTYYFVVEYTDEDGNLGTSDEISFSTAPAPAVSKVEVTELGINTVYISFTVENSSSISLDYGKTIDYGSSKTLTTSVAAQTHTIKIDKLEEDTLYHFTVTSKDAEGYSYTGDDYTFTTLPTPKVIKSAIQQVRGMATATVRLLWLSNTPVSSIVTYYPEGHKEAAYDKVSVARKTGHEVLIKDLEDNTNYVFIVKGRDIAGNEVEPLIKTIKTAQDLRAPRITNLQVESSIRGVGEDAWAQIVISYKTDEPTTSQVEYGEGSAGAFSAKTQEGTKPEDKHYITIPNLIPSKVYHLQVIAKDESDNISRSVDTVIITPKATNSAFDLVIKNLSGTFGFLSALAK